MDPLLSDQERAKELAQQHADMVQTYKQAMRVIDRSADESMRSFIELGRVGVALKQAQNRPIFPDFRIWPDSMIAAIARDLGVHGPTFRQALAAVELFTPEQLQMFLERPSRRGLGITPKHLEVILRAPTTAKRLHLIEFYYRRSATVRQLSAELRRLTDRPKACLPRPRELAGAVTQVSRMASTLCEKLTTDLDKVLMVPLREFIDGKGSAEPTHLKLVTRLSHELETLREALDSTIAMTNKAKAALARRLETAV
jgi:hypothetical protein